MKKRRECLGCRVASMATSLLEFSLQRSIAAVVNLTVGVSAETQNRIQSPRVDPNASKKPTMRSALLVATLLFGLQANAGPFSIPIGATLQDIEKQNIGVRPTDEPYVYVLQFPNQKAEHALDALILPKYGMCEMRWLTTVDPLSPSGSELKSVYLEIYNGVNQGLGQPDYQNTPGDGAPTDDVWKSVYLQKHTLLAAWEKAKNSEGDVTSLRLEASSDDPGRGVVRLTVSAPYIDKCLAAQKRAAEG